MTAAEVGVIEMRFLNWGRWARPGGMSPSRCASAEGRYLPPKLADGETALSRTVMPLDVLDAELLERAICRHPSHWDRRVLKLRFVVRLDRETLKGRLRMESIDLVDALLWRVMGQVMDEVRAIKDEEPQLIRKGKALWAGVARITKAGV